MRFVTRARIRAGLLVLIGLLYLLSVPWYRDAADAPTRVLGLPGWVLVAIACYAAVAGLNAAAWLLTEIPDDPEEAEPRGTGPPHRRAQP